MHWMSFDYESFMEKENTQWFFFLKRIESLSWTEIVGKSVCNHGQQKRTLSNNEKLVGPECLYLLPPPNSAEEQAFAGTDVEKNSDPGGKDR